MDTCNFILWQCKFLEINGVFGECFRTIIFSFWTIFFVFQYTFSPTHNFKKNFKQQFSIFKNMYQTDHMNLCPTSKKIYQYFFLGSLCLSSFPLIYIYIYIYTFLTTFITNFDYFYLNQQFTLLIPFQVLHRQLSNHRFHVVCW